MKTKRVISCISYNSPDFLENCLNELYDAHKIAFWTFIQHHGEVNDESGLELKDHIHVFIEPNVAIDTMDMSFPQYDYLDKSTGEIIKFAPDKPLKCVGYRFSKWVDWFLYTLHLKWYLAMKGEEKEFSYSVDEYWTCDIDEFRVRSFEAFHDNDIIKQHRLLSMLNDPEVNKLDLIKNGMVRLSDTCNLVAFEKLRTRSEYMDYVEELHKNGFDLLEDSQSPFQEGAV